MSHKDVPGNSGRLLSIIFHSPND